METVNTTEVKQEVKEEVKQELKGGSVMSLKKLHRSTIKLLRRGMELEAMVEENQDKSISEICAMLGISRAMYYKVMNNYYSKQHLTEFLPEKQFPF